MNIDPNDTESFGPENLEQLSNDAAREREAQDRDREMQDREAMYRLVQNDRLHNAEAGMPDNLAERKQLIKRVLDQLERSNISQGVLARQIGVSRGTLSNYFSLKYPGDNARIDQALSRWLNRQAMRDEAKRPKDYVETRIAEEERSIINLAWKHNYMATIIAPSGCGKTYVARMACEELNGVFLTVNHTFTPREFLMQLAIAIGWNETKRGTQAELHRWIISALKGTNRPVFIDEAHILGKTINFVRAIHDEAETPIILIGTAEILGFIDDRAHGSGQFASRTITYNALEKSRGMGTPEDGPRAAAQCLFSVDEVRAFFASRGIRLDKDAMRLAWQLANLPGFGSLRLVERAAAVVFDLQPDTQTIERDQLIMALRLLHSADFDRMQRLVRAAEEKPKVAAMA